MTPAEIAAARATLGLTQAQLAGVMGLRGSATVSDWERGAKPANPQNIRLLQAYLDGYRPPDWPD